MAQGGVSLLSKTAASAEDPQTLRMVAGAVANLCGNGMQHVIYYCLSPKCYTISLPLSRNIPFPRDALMTILGQINYRKN